MSCLSITFYTSVHAWSTSVRQTYALVVTVVTVVSGDVVIVVIIVVVSGDVAVGGWVGA